MSMALFYAFTMILFLGGIVLWDGIASHRNKE